MIQQNCHLGKNSGNGLIKYSSIIESLFIKNNERLEKFILPIKWRTHHLKNARVG